MKIHAIFGIALSIFSIFFLISCAHVQASEDEKMLSLGASLRNLCSAMEDAVKYENLPEGLSDTEILARVTDYDPGLLAPFAEFSIKPLIQDNSAILLVCTKDREIGLLEDACCSYPLDKHLWKETPPKPCRISLKIQEACPPK